MTENNDNSQNRDAPAGPSGFEDLTGPAAFEKSKPETAGEDQAPDPLAPESEESYEQPINTADQGVPVSPEEENALQARAKALEAELQDTKNQLMRAVAETENIRKRAQREREDTGKYAISGFARDMLDVADNLRRALDSAPENRDDLPPQVKNLLEGIEATEREMLKAFDKHGIEKLEPMDQKFDPNFHEVMFEAPMPDKEPGTIIQLVEAGYMLNDRLLRPARVGVAKSDGAQAQSQAGSGSNFDSEA